MLIKQDPASFQSYLSDASRFTGTCEAVYFPENAGEVAEVVTLANRTGTPLTIAGNGTGLTGGRCPEGGLLLSTERMLSTLTVDRENKTITVSAGITLSAMQETLASEGLFFPQDPTEQLCFAGGIVATNASGAKSFHYGPVRNSVRCVEVVLPNAEIVRIERGQTYAHDGKFFQPFHNIPLLTVPDYRMPAVKNAAGYYAAPDMDIIDLFIGSEGTLGIITEVQFTVQPLPERIISCVCFFNSETEALSFIADARSNAKNGSTCSARALEFFDGHSLRFLHDSYHQIPASAGAAVWFEQECSIAEEYQLLELWMQMLSGMHVSDEHVWFATSENERKTMQEFRHAISYQVNEYIARKGLRKLGTDTAVPENCFPDFYTQVKSLVQSAGLSFVAYGHFGDCHLHLNMLPNNEQEFATAKSVYRSICQLSVSLGGTVSAEHGIGKAKREFLLMMYGTLAVEQMKQLKLQLDPANLLNRGNLFF